MCSARIMKPEAMLTWELELRGTSPAMQALSQMKVHWRRPYTDEAHQNAKKKALSNANLSLLASSLYLPLSPTLRMN